MKDISIRFGGEKADVDVKLELWDIAGNKTIADVKREFYKDANGAIIVADLSKEKSVDECENWIKATYQIIDKIPFIFVGNKYSTWNDITFTRPYGCESRWYKIWATSVKNSSWLKNELIA